MSKLNKMPDYSSAQSRTLHDMTHDFAFTTPCGPLLPIEHDILLPGDKIECKVDFNVRNILPFDAPAGVDFDFHLDYFFVPMELIYKPFATYVYGQNDEWSSMFASYSNHRIEVNSNIRLPLIDSADLYGYLSTLGSSGSTTMETYGKSFQRLFDLLGFPTFDERVLNDHYDFDTESMDFPICPNFFPWQLAAYQCIFQKYFRLEEYDKYRPTFNLDKYYQNSKIQVTYDSDTKDFAASLCELHFRPFYKDYFTSVKPNPMYNDLNQNQEILNSLEFVQSSFDASHVDNLPNSNYIRKEGIVNSLSGNSLISNSANFDVFGDLFNYDSFRSNRFVDHDAAQNSVNQLRALFATEKLLYVTQRAGKNYDDQTLAHFGIKVPHDSKHDLTHIGHCVHTMHIGEVTSLADTSSGENGRLLGAYAGKGYLNTSIQGFGKNKEIKFTAPCHGVFMAIFSCVPRVSYDVPVLKKNIVQNRLDLFQPEFDHLGMQPIFRYEIDPFSYEYKTEDDGDIYINSGNALDETFMSEIVGWQFRYEEKKRQFNRASAAFKSGSLSPWILQVKPLQHMVKYEGQVTGEGDEQEYLVHSQNQRPLIDLYCYPTITDGIFSANYTKQWETIQTQFDTDPFMVNSRINYKKISIMSTYSMPKLD